MTQNENIFLVIKAAIVGCAGAFSAAFGWLGWLILAWVACMAVDFITGTGAASKNKEWSSSKARAGIWHKAGMLVVVIVAWVTDGVLGIAVNTANLLPMKYTLLILPVVLMWYILTELGSILENAVAMGAPVPPFLVQILAAAKDKVEEIGGGEDKKSS